ncbi:peptidase, partial [Streptomyces violascens]
MEIRRVARLLTVALACVSASAIAPPAATAAPTPHPAPTAGPGAFAAAPYTADPAPAVRSRVVDAAQKALAAHASAAHKADGDAFSVRNLVVDRDGAAAVRFDRTYKGLPAYGGDVIVHLKNDGTYASLATGSQASGAVTTEPQLPASSAAKVSAGAFKGHVDSVSASHLAVQRAGADATLVWETVVSGTRPDRTPSRLHVLVDARTGKVVRTNDEVSTFAAEGAAHATASKVGVGGGGGRPPPGAGGGGGRRGVAGALRAPE